MKVYCRRAAKILLLAALVFSAAGCVDFSKVKVTSFDIGSFSPHGFRSAEMVVSLGVRDDSKGFTVSDLEGVVYKDGVQIGTVASSGTTILGKTSQKYEIPLELAISNISIFQVIALVQDMDVDGLTADLSFKLKIKGGSSKRITLRDIPLRQFVDRALKYGT